MNVVLSDGVIESLTDAPRNVQRAFEKQLRFLVDNLLHASRDAKKYKEWNDRAAVWTSAPKRHGRMSYAYMYNGIVKR